MHIIEDDCRVSIVGIPKAKKLASTLTSSDGSRRIKKVSLDPKPAGSVSPDPKDVGSVSPKAAGSVSPDLEAVGSVSSDPLGAGSISPDPKDTISVSPDLEDTGSVSSDGDPYRRQSLQVRAYGPRSKL